jgi:tRNA (cmo5U34)-methyltransferase
MTNDDSRNIKTPNPWTFNEEVTASFQDMLERSIPELHELRYACRDFADRFAVPGTPIVDLGASLGGAVLSMLYSMDEDFDNFVLIENSPAMIHALTKRWGLDERVTILSHDLAVDGAVLPKQVHGASFVMSILTLQFVPIPRRSVILEQVCDAMIDGGAFILAEKCEVGGVIGAHMRDEYRAFKLGCGYTEAQVDEKAKALEGVLVPLTARTNEALLRAAGFSHVECFWRVGLFAGWIAIK